MIDLVIMLIGVGFLFVAWTGLILRNWQKQQDEEIKNLYYIIKGFDKKNLGNTAIEVGDLVEVPSYYLKGLCGTLRNDFFTAVILMINGDNASTDLTGYVPIKDLRLLKKVNDRNKP